MSEFPLPDGWIKAYDSTNQHFIWVDTKATPPRVIWSHPFEDPQFLKEHPDIKAQVGKPSEPPPYEATVKRRHSFSGGDASSVRAIQESHPHHSSKAKQRGLFGKLKDKAIRTKEEREEHKREREEERKRERRRHLETRLAYMQQHGGYAPYHSSYGGFSGSGGSTLVAGLAGGLLLGDLLSSGF